MLCFCSEIVQCCDFAVAVGQAVQINLKAHTQACILQGMTLQGRNDPVSRCPLGGRAFTAKPFLFYR